MLIAGSVSGIQDYLFDVAQEGGGQARRLRARSFFMQLLTEVACLRVLQAADWDVNQIIFSGAGKFLLQGGSLDAAQQSAFAKVEHDINRWLLTETGASLRFALVSTDTPDGILQQHKEVGRLLEIRKRRAWAIVALSEGSWLTEHLILPPLDTPCALCRRHKAEFEDVNDGTTRRVCRRCAEDRDIGRQLPSVRWVMLSALSAERSFAIGGWHASLLESEPRLDGSCFILSLEGNKNGSGSASQTNFIRRSLLRHVPTKNEAKEPREFLELAKLAAGDKLLGVLKMDADKVGRHITKLLQGASDLKPLKDFSKEFDDFFAKNLDQKLRAASQWNLIYTIFSGGDDLLLVGPWNVLFDFAAEVRRSFAQQFGSRYLTLSGGLALIKPKRPIKFAAAHADELLEQAKEEAAPGEDESRDQFAAFGQVWKWKSHEAIAKTSKGLVHWTNQGLIQRGWLHTLLRLAELRQSVSAKDEAKLATARLAHHIARNYPKRHDPDPRKQEVRRWADVLVDDFDQMRRTETKYLPAIMRYALTATRHARSE